MSLARKLIDNHPLANITFAVVLLLGLMAYLNMPRAQDPEINFNWVSVITTLPGASAEDIEREVTSPLEDAIKQIKDVKFVQSNSRENVSSLLIRFNELSEREFDKRLADLRREIQNKASTELPQDANDPGIYEITTSNGFPTAIVALYGPAGGEQLRKLGVRIKGDIERIKGVDKIITAGFADPQLQVEFDPAALAARGMAPQQVSDAVAAWYRNTLAGRVRVMDREWLLRMEGKSTVPVDVADIPVQLGQQTLRVGDLADVSRGTERVGQLVSYNGQPALMLSVTKQAKTNTLDLVERINDFIATQNGLLASQGAQLVLLDDQTIPTREAIGIMESNALYGWILVMAVCWVFLGTRISVLVGLGIPFALAGTFAIVAAMGSTLNLTILLGVVIALGMLVDDAVVIVESIYYRLQRGEAPQTAVFEGVREVAWPVASSVLTTCAAFLPLMLLPGILGKFMFWVPFVVTVALLVSLIEAYWMIPVHVLAMKINLHEKKSRTQIWRERFTHALRLRYAQWLLKVMRWPKLSAGITFGSVLLAAVLVATGLVKQQFFAFDPLRIYYINVDLPPGSTLEATLSAGERAAAVARQHLKEGEMRSVSTTAGIKFTETEPLYGDQYGQVIVSLQARQGDMRTTPEVIAAMRADIENLNAEARYSFLELSGGPPTAKAISVKIRGDDYAELRAATDRMLAAVKRIPGTKNVTDDDVAGRSELRLTLNRAAIEQAGLSPAYVARALRLFGEGEILSSTRDDGEKVDVVVRARPAELSKIEDVLSYRLPLPQGGMVPLATLVDTETKLSKGFIRHHQLRRAITLEGDLDKEITDTVAANDQLKAAWAGMQADFPNVSLDFSGELDDIEESLGAMKMLFALGIGLIYLILAAQFRSYWQPLLILVTVPLAFSGVIFGLFISGNPVSLYTLYGVIALAGIAVNSAIVLIDAANERRLAGMSVLHATVYAARRRVVPILITSTTTIAGLFSLAVGLGGQSLLWGPVASAIVWGLGFSTLLTLFAIPLLYKLVMSRHQRGRDPSVL
ncbi:efflux RND transporter permease subunit [Chitinimonas sp. BJYL2]|uniref:efflux RND transporter permease subunit n=1 Tax=Chitinimonas sp. BJYL2 TaxID=2976696 RepID=UPI0022B565CE|nr:efflux RND transporter permease subunit [Chitinimonas sp. BJYL2]